MKSKHVTSKYWAVISLVVILLLFTVGSGCAQKTALQAEFAGNPTSGTSPLGVQFADESAGEIATWVWDFGDGTSSTVQNPSHTYNAVGTYDVSLTVVGPEGSKTVTKSGYIEVSAVQKAKITLGLMTDFTGAAAPALVPFTWGIQDMNKYWNDEGLLPGVEIEVAYWDTKLDPARYVPGYDWLKEQGAKVMWCPSTAFAESILAKAVADKTPIMVTGASDILLQSGWVFNIAPDYAKIAKGTLKWMSENDWNYAEKGRAPKIGSIGVNRNPQAMEIAAVEQYCAAHSDKFNYVGTYMVPVSALTYSTEVEALKDCDYIYQALTGGVLNSMFTAAYRAGGGTAKIVGDIGMSSYIGVMIGKVGWDACNGTLTPAYAGWWTYDTPFSDLAKQLLVANHPKDAISVMGAGLGGYSGYLQAEYVFSLLKAVVEKVGGANNVSGETFNNAAKNISVPVAGFSTLTFADPDRTGMKTFDLWRWDATKRDLVRATSDFIPVVD